MVTNCKCVVGSDPKAAVRKELVSAFDGYCKDAFSRGMSAMSFQEWMIERLIEAREPGTNLRKFMTRLEGELAKKEQRITAQVAQLAQYHQTFLAQEHKIAELYERIEKFEQLPNNGFTTLYATIVKNGEPVTIYTMDPANIEHWKRRALSAEASEAEEINKRLEAWNRTEKAEAELNKLKDKIAKVLDTLIESD
jgi:uncharacterized coiled-coil protein SlyX